MAGNNEDIRLRDQVAPALSPAVQNKLAPVKGIDFGRLAKEQGQRIDADSKALRAQEKALLKAQADATAKADKIRLTDFSNKARSMYNKSQAKIVTSEGQETSKTIDAENEQLNKQLEKMIEADMPEHLKEQARIDANTYRLPHEKIAATHEAKEIEKFADDILKKKVKHEALSVLQAVGDNNLIESNLVLVREASLDVAKGNGITDKEALKEIGDAAEGDAILGAMEVAANSANFEETKSIHETFKGKIVTPEQYQKSLKLLKSAEDNGNIAEAIKLKDLAFKTYPNSSAKQRMFIEMQAGDGKISGKVIKESLSMQKTQQLEIQRVDKINKERKSENAVKTIFRKEPGALLKAISEAPHDEEHLRKINANINGFTQTDSSLYVELLNTYRYDEEAFKDINLRSAKYIAGLNSKELNHFQGFQDELFKGDKTQRKSILNSNVKSVAKEVDQIIVARGVDKSIDPGAYQTKWSEATDIYNAMVESEKDKPVFNDNKNAFDKAFVNRFRDKSLTTKEVQGFFYNDDPEGISQTAIIDRNKLGENILDIEEGNELDVDAVRKALIRNSPDKKTEPSDEELQDAFNIFIKNKAGLRDLRIRKINVQRTGK